MHPCAALLLICLGVTSSTAEFAGVRKARTCLKKKKLDAARKELAPALLSVDPKLVVDARLLAADVELAAKKPDAAKRHWDAILPAWDAAGNPPEKLYVRLEAAGKAAKEPALVARIKDLRTADKSLPPLSRWPLLPAPPSPDAQTLQAMSDIYAREGLGSRVKQVAVPLALAWAAAGDARGVKLAERQLAECESGTGGAACRTAARRLGARLRTLLLMAGGRDSGGATQVLKLAADADVEDASLTGEPMWRRSAATVALCAAVEAVMGKGSCRTLEDKAGIAATFQDFSKGPELPGISDADVARTQEEYGWLLSRCLRRGMEQDQELAGVSIEVEWVVQPNGIPNTIGVAPKRRADHAALVCMKKAVETFRYPRSRSQELRNVLVPLRAG